MPNSAPPAEAFERELLRGGDYSDYAAAALAGLPASDDAVEAARLAAFSGRSIQVGGLLFLFFSMWGAPLALAACSRRSIQVRRLLFLFSPHVGGALGTGSLFGAEHPGGWAAVPVCYARVPPLAVLCRSEATRKGGLQTLCMQSVCTGAVAGLLQWLLAVPLAWGQ